MLNGMTEAEYKRRYEACRNEARNREPVSQDNSTVAELPLPPQYGNGRRFVVYTYYALRPDIPVIYGVLWTDAGLRCPCLEWRKNRRECEHTRLVQLVVDGQYEAEIEAIVSAVLGR